MISGGAACRPRRRLAPRLLGAGAVVVALFVASATTLADVRRDPFRLEAGGYVEGYFVAETDSSSQRQLPEGILSLHVDGKAWRWLRVHAEARGFAGGPWEDPDGAGVFNLDDTFANISPALEIEEALATLSWGPADLNLGKQKFSWGRLDGTQPNDVLNPEVYFDPLVPVEGEDVERKIGVPAAALSYYVPEPPPALRTTNVRFTVVYEPIYVPVRFPVPGTRWFPPAAEAAERLRIGLRGARNRSVSAVANVRVRFGVQDLPPPARTLRNGSIALRLSGATGPVEWSLYYVNGQEVLPHFRLATRARLTKLISRLGEPPVAFVRAGATLLPAFERIELFGFDLGGAVGAATVRAEWAYVRSRPYPLDVREIMPPLPCRGANPLGAGNLRGRCKRLIVDRKPVQLDTVPAFVERDGAEWGVGADYLIHGFMPLLQVNQIVVLDNRRRLLIDDLETRLVGSVRKSFMQEKLEVEIRGVLGIPRSQALVTPMVRYSIRDDLSARVGYVFVAGTRNSMIGEFKANDEVFVRIRYSF